MTQPDMSMEESEALMERETGRKFSITFLRTMAALANSDEAWGARAGIGRSIR